ncbi:MULTISPECIES: hypothetical protein [Paraburkholderia]|jgi:hypothetical protein|uniref:Uncharacterized protein n=1 Tax=Paraburkholderia phenazinium TaxID=60549 RepID=A0A1N6KRN2_9BURK|nr:hypothetical protein [Paraburkholderia phenazinium]SIO59208.1 hypothetical protein SAMN05444165_4433 [Paraburkholderia phenazinium]
MNTKHSKKEHLEAAASHHEQAGRLHREASRHFEDGKDFAHAAHQAMLAHGHTLHAIDRANEALKHHAGAPLAVPTADGPADSHAGAAQHHAIAAELHEQAARHLRNAVKHFDEDRGAVAHDTQLALSLALRGLFHGNEAAKQHVAALRDKDPAKNTT